MFRPVEVRTLQAEVYRQLRHGLAIGLFAPGEEVTLRRLAVQFGTSPMPVRDAVNRLIAERALEMRGNRTVIVPNMTRTRFEELTRVRELIEGEAAEQASKLSGAELVGRLERTNATFLNRVGARDVQAALAANRDFHFALYAAARTQIMMPIIESLWLQVGPFLRLSLVSTSKHWNAARHREAIIGLKKRDGKLVRAAIEADIRTTADHLLKTASFADR